MLLLQNRKPLHSPSHAANPLAAILNGWCPSQLRLPGTQQKSKFSGLTPNLCTTHCVVCPATGDLRSPQGLLRSTSELDSLPLWGPLACVDSKEGLGERSSKANGPQRCSSVTLTSPPLLDHSSQQRSIIHYILPKFWASSSTRLIRGSQIERYPSSWPMIFPSTLLKSRTTVKVYSSVYVFSDTP